MPEEFTDNYEIKGSLSWGGDLDPLSRCVCRKSGDFFGLKILTKPYPGDIPKLQTQVFFLCVFFVCVFFFCVCVCDMMLFDFYFQIFIKLENF